MASILIRNKATAFTVCLGDVALLEGGTLAIVADIFHYDSPAVTRRTAEVGPGAMVGLTYETIDGPLCDGGADALVALVTNAYTRDEFKAGHPLPQGLTEYLLRSYINVPGYSPIELREAAELFFTQENLAWYEKATAVEVAA